MKSTSYLAVDLGASSGRAILGTLEDGCMRLQELYRFTTPIIECDGHLFWDLDAIERALQTGLQEARSIATHLRSVSVNSWGVDYVSLDENGRPLRNAYCYRDPRVLGMFEKAFEFISAEEIYRLTGIQFMEINSIYQVLADREEEPDLFKKTACRMPMADYYNYLLSGVQVSEISLASTTQAMDVHHPQWSTELHQRLGLPIEAWPRIVPSGTCLGPVRDAPGIQVVASCSHDTACAVAATPATPGTRWAYLSCGSWSLLGIERADPLISETARNANYTNEAGLDGTIRLLKNLTGLWVMQECERAWKEEGATYTYDLLMEETVAATSNGFYLDLNDPRFSLRGNMEQKLKDYCREAGAPIPENRGQIVRAILESLTKSYGDTLRYMESVLGHPIKVLHMVGGGVKNRLLCQWTADACDVTVVAGPVEATALGNLLIQARAMNDLPPDLTIRDVVRKSVALETYEPAGT